MIGPLAVVDASVALKWVLEEDLSDRARALLAHGAQQRQTLRPLVP